MNRLLLWLFGVRVLRMQRGDVLLIRGTITHAQGEMVSKYLSDHFGFKVPVVWGGSDARFEILRSQEAA